MNMNCIGRWPRRATWLVSSRRPRCSSWSPRATLVSGVSTRRAARTFKSSDLWFWLQASNLRKKLEQSRSSQNGLRVHNDPASFACFGSSFQNLSILWMFQILCCRWFWCRLHQQFLAGTVQTGPASFAYHQRRALHRRRHQDGRGEHIPLAAKKHGKVCLFPGVSQHGYNMTPLPPLPSSWETPSTYASRLHAFFRPLAQSASTWNGYKSILLDWWSLMMPMPRSSFWQQRLDLWMEEIKRLPGWNGGWMWFKCIDSYGFCCTL